MDADVAATTIKFCLAQIRDKLEQAASIAKAADACAQAGNPEKAVEIALDIEHLTFDAGTLLNAASLINRIVDP
jgi:hypothetical protein